MAGPRSTRSPRNSARRPGGGVAVRAIGIRHVAQLVEELDELSVTTVNVTDDVEGPGVGPAVVPQRLALERRRLDLVVAVQDVDAVKPFPAQPPQGAAEL